MELFQLERKEPGAMPPADRLVLFVGDGLRADKTFLSFPEPYPKSDEDLTPDRLPRFCAPDEDFEDFSSDATALDYWVFDHVKEFFAEATRNETLNEALRQDRIVFFLHLLGLDTAGHFNRPYSKEYLHNLQVVDAGVKEIVELIESFYQDDRTAFVFTADHGMSDWGSHGDGHPDNTRTPLIAWGSGIAKPVAVPDAIAPGHDDFSSEWGLDHIKRHDVNQADVAALMAYLIGAEFPANSVGELPLSYLSADIKEKAEASLLNAREILEMYRVKEAKKKETELRYKAFEPLGQPDLTPSKRLTSIQKLILAGQYEEAIEESDSLMKLGLQGFRYLQTQVLFGHIQSGPALFSLFINATLYVGLIVSLALAYIHREILTVLYLVGVLWPLGHGIGFVQKHAVLSGTWMVSCLIMSTFTLFPAMKTESIPLIMAGGVPMALIGIFYLVFEDAILSGVSSRKSRLPGTLQGHGFGRILIGIQVGFIILAMVVTRSSALSLQAKQGLPRGNQIVGWVVMVGAFAMPLASRTRTNKHYLHRLLVMFLTCAPTFILLTISYEGLFYVAFSVTLVSWVSLEHRIYVDRVAARAAAPRISSGPTTKGKAKTGFRP
ncbi:unnamed protein product [Parascedosporium putredinis]|uniref:GPI ethanolamine phosphate transferase 1 n=1 Tax=Parascedosporium putredinis TaxID=1442378 RepID=A0A9P1HC33_9PEZI|nr:unnamed protein product [Parascedosporium putredinis]CAI8004516.1 unnamed protein product [Parascedosporium putredinis]